MRYDDGIPERKPIELEPEREQRLKILSSKYGSRVDGWKLECLDLRKSFPNASVAAKTLNAMGYPVTRNGIVKALFRARNNGYSAFHAGLRFRHLREPVLPRFEVPGRLFITVKGKTYSGTPAAARACGVARSTMANSIRRGYLVVFEDHEVELRREEGKRKLTVFVDGKFYPKGVPQVAREFGIPMSTAYYSAYTGTMTIRRHYPVTVVRKETAIQRKAA